MNTVRGEYTLRCKEAAVMTELMVFNVEGLRQRSEWALVQQDVSKQGQSL